MPATAWIGGATGMHCSTASHKRRANRLGMIELIGLEALGDVPHQPAGQHLRDVGLDQLRVGRHQRAGQVGQQVVDVSVAAQGLDHRVQPAELLAEPRLQGRRRRRPAAIVADLRPGRPRLTVDAPTGIVSVAVTSTSARGPRPKSRRRRTSRADRITASPPRSRRTRVRASFIVLAR